MGHFRYDLTPTIRSLAKTRAFSIIAVVTLAVGIGAAVTLFAAADGVLLQRLPVEHEDRVVLLRRIQQLDETIVPFGYSDLRALQSNTGIVEDAGGVQYDGAFSWVVVDGQTPETLMGSLVSGEFFRVLGARPALGRLLEPDDAVTGAEPVVVLSYRAWLSRFAGDPGILGRRLRINGEMRTVVGVGPRDFEYPADVEMWVPTVEKLAGAGDEAFSLLLRLVPGTSPADAQPQLSRFIQERERVAPVGDLRGNRASVISIRDAILGDVQKPITALSIAVGLVLVIAVANVAGLVLVRGVERQRDLAIRSALGASRPRLVGELLVECCVLVLWGAAGGLLLADWGIRGLVLMAPHGLPRVDNVALSARAFGFTSLIALVLTTALGLASAVTITRLDPSPGFLRSAARGASPRRGAGGKEGLVVLQIALALLVAIAAGLLMKSLGRMRHVDFGFESVGLSVVQLDVPWDDSTSSEQYHRLIEQVTDRVGGLGGVSNVTPALMAPFSGRGGWNAFYALKGQTRSEIAANPASNFEAVMPGYFRTLGIPILTGRGFTADDRPGAMPVAIVSRGFARRAWPGQDPIGRQVGLGSLEQGGTWFTIVGVVGDARYRDLLTLPPTIYLPLSQTDQQPLWLLLRTGPGKPISRRTLQAAVSEAASQGLVLSVTPLVELLAGPLARPRFVSALALVFALLALGLAAVGLYGLMSSIIASRGREMGIRMALGAQTGRIRRMVLGQASLITVGGILSGLVLAFVTTRWLQSLLYETGALDPLTVATVTAAVLLIATGAAYVPALRATRVDPASALRAE